uniref:CX domain-containing protein n=1 Tax=Plectus sambesii TaxID=2011161 RepID=A0A914VM36_9BILA
MLLLIAFVCSLAAGTKRVPPRSDGRSDSLVFQEVLNYTVKVAVNDQSGHTFYYFNPNASYFNGSSVAFDSCICSQWINAATTDFLKTAAAPLVGLNETTDRLQIYWDCCMSELSCCPLACCKEEAVLYFPMFNLEEKSDNNSTSSPDGSQYSQYKEPHRSTIEKVAVGVFLLVLIVPLYLIIRCLYWECIRKGKDSGAQPRPVIVEPQSQGSNTPQPPLTPRLPTVTIEGRSNNMLEMQPTVHLQPPSPTFSTSNNRAVALNESLSSMESTPTRFQKELQANEPDRKTEQKTGLERFANDHV